MHLQMSRQLRLLQQSDEDDNEDDRKILDCTHRKVLDDTMCS
jgi:hypothetical protein